MLFTFFAILYIGIAAYFLTKKYNSQAVLIVVGLLMLTTVVILGGVIPDPKKPTGLLFFDVIGLLNDALISKAAGVGMMIMVIGGFVAYMKHIGASNALVELASTPIRFMDKTPYLAASCVIPIGQFLFMAAPSATGLGLLLMAAIYPILSKLKISKVSIVAVITSATVFDLGPASANTNKAADVIGSTATKYFSEYQFYLAISLTICLMVMYYFVNKYFDKKQGLELDHGTTEETVNDQKPAPKYYALFPVLPLILLFGFSPDMGNGLPKLFALVSSDFPQDVVLKPIHAMLTALLLTIVVEFIVVRNLKEVLSSLKVFWEGMGKVFASVVTLIVAAEMFSTGLKSLGFVDALVEGATSLGLGYVGITIVMTLMIFGASMLMGSGNASFFAFGDLVPNLIKKIIEGMGNALPASVQSAMATKMILSMQFASSMGRACSPIAGVIIATSEIAGISSFDLAKRNLIPLSVTLILLFIFQFLVLPMFLVQFETP